MKIVLGLDLGTNSIGWAVVNEADYISEELDKKSHENSREKDYYGL